MQLTAAEEAMLAGREGPAKQRAMAGLVQLGRAFGAPRMVEIGYAHIHAGMALYLEDVELMEELAEQGARMAVPASVNIANADTVDWKKTGAPEALARLQQRAADAQHKMGSACTFTCTPYWAGHWPTWNTHMTSIESTVTIFCNSALLGCAFLRFNGENPTVGDGFRTAFARLPQIFAWALVSATVGLLLKLVEQAHEKVGQFVASLLGTAWSIMTYFVVPVLVVEKTGPMEAVSRSVALLKKTWGEALVGRMGIGLVLMGGLQPRNAPSPSSWATTEPSVPIPRTSTRAVPLPIDTRRDAASTPVVKLLVPMGADTRTSAESAADQARPNDAVWAPSA